MESDTKGSIQVPLYLSIEVYEQVKDKANKLGVTPVELLRVGIGAAIGMSLTPGFPIMPPPISFPFDDGNHPIKPLFPEPVSDAVGVLPAGMRRQLAAVLIIAGTKCPECTKKFTMEMYDKGECDCGYFIGF